MEKQTNEKQDEKFVWIWVRLKALERDCKLKFNTWNLENWICQNEELKSHHVVNFFLLKNANVFIILRVF